MKKIIFTLLGFILLHFANAQYCGNSGPSTCDTGNLTEKGFSPRTVDFPPFINGQPTDAIILFKNFDTIRKPVTLEVLSLKIDSITNLPDGICWATGDSNNTFAKLGNGCIRFSGTPNAPHGQYKLQIYTKLNTALPVSPAQADAAGLKYWIRVFDPTDAVVPVDTCQTALFAAYGTTPEVCQTGINSIENYLNSVKIVPNPFSRKADVSFTSSRPGLMVERVTNLLGGEIFKRDITVRVGNNISTLDRNDVAPGIYFYSIGDGKAHTTKRIVISE